MRPVLSNLHEIDVAPREATITGSSWYVKKHKVGQTDRVPKSCRYPLVVEGFIDMVAFPELPNQMEMEAHDDVYNIRDSSNPA
jgi:hypothetical protein